MEQNASEFLSSGYLLSAQHELLRNKIDDLLAEIRPQAVPLVDGWALPDYLLNSALGRYDGNVYPALVDFASREPSESLTVLILDAANMLTVNGITYDVKVDTDNLFMEKPIENAEGLGGRPMSKM